MKEVLSGFTEIPGALGAALFDSNGKCVCHMLPAPYQEDILGQAFKKIQSAFDAIDATASISPQEEFVGMCSAGCIVVRPISEYSLMVLAERDVNMGLIRVAFNAAVLKNIVPAIGTPPPDDPEPDPPAEGPDKKEQIRTAIALFKVTIEALETSLKMLEAADE